MQDLQLLRADLEAVLAADSLKLLNVAFTGIDHVGLDACAQKGVTVCNAADYSNETVAELVIPGLFELGAELDVVFEEDAWYELSDGSCGTISGRVPDLTGRYVLVLCTEYDPGAERAVANTIWEKEPPGPTNQKG